MRSTGALALCFLLAAVLFMSAMTEAVTAESKRVMLLHSFGTEFRPWSEYAKTIRDELNRQSPWPLDITEQSLVTARSSDEVPEVPFVEYLRSLFAKRPLDLIVSIGAPAAGFCPAAPATSLCHHPDGVHGSGPASRSVLRSHRQ